MAEDTSGAAKYVGNSNRDKQPDAKPVPKVEQITSAAGVQRKKSVSRRIAENFTGADASSVGQHVLFDVILPRVKDLIFDVGESALRRALFGDGAKGIASRGSSVRGYTPYNTIATSATPKVMPQNNKPMVWASDEFGEIIVPSRGEAAEVMDKMGNLIETYGMASVSDLKAAVGLTGSFTDEKFGWITMGGTDVRRVGGNQPGYLLIFPRAEELP